MTLEHFLILGAVLFCVGLLGAFTRRNAVVVLFSIEIMLNAANLNFIAFWRFSENPDALHGPLFTLFTIAVAAAEVAVGLALQRVLRIVQCMIGKLDEERLFRRMILFHERNGPPAHAEDVYRVGVLVRCGILVAGVPIVRIIPMLSRTASANVPFAVMGGGVPDSLEHFRDGRFLPGNVFANCRGDEFVAIGGRHCWRGLGPLQLRRALAGLQTDTRGRAD